MKSLLSGCAAAALILGLATQAHAQTVVRDAPVHAVPVDEDDDPAADAPAARAEPAPVIALTQANAPRSPALTPEESAFFTALGHRVTNDASAYETYVRRAGAIDPAFHGAASVQRAVRLGAAYQTQQLEEGIVAYAALIALRNPDFVEGVRAVQSRAFADGLSDHPELVMQVRGAPAAAADVAGVLRSQGESLIAAGNAVTKAAYDIQAQSWSKSPVADPKGVLDSAKTSAERVRTATVPSKEKLLDSLVIAPQAGEPSAHPAPDVVRGLALAALAISGRTGDGNEAQYEVLLGDFASTECLKLAKLNLNQCLAVAGPHYEDAYCAGRHAVSDTGKCITAAAGGGPTLDAAPQPRLQEADAVGPEQAAVYGRASPKDDEDDDDEDLAPPSRVQAAVAQPAPVPAPAPALTAAAPSPAPLASVEAPRQYAEAPALQAQRAEPTPDPRLAQQQQAAIQPPLPANAPQPQLQAPPQPQTYAQNDYAPQPAYQPPAYPQQPYPQQTYPQQSYPQPTYPQQTYPQQAYPQQTYPQQAYPQAQYQPQPYAQQYAQQSYPQPQYAPQPYPQTYAQGYAPQPYAQPRSSYPPNYSGQPYYPQQQRYYPGGYYGR
jgi:hypothetical protein